MFPDSLRLGTRTATPEHRFEGDVAQQGITLSLSQPDREFGERPALLKPDTLRSGRHIDSMKTAACQSGALDGIVAAAAAAGYDAFGLPNDWRGDTNDTPAMVHALSSDARCVLGAPGGQYLYANDRPFGSVSCAAAAGFFSAVGGVDVLSPPYAHSLGLSCEQRARDAYRLQPLQQQQQQLLLYGSHSRAGGAQMDEAFRLGAQQSPRSADLPTPVHPLQPQPAVAAARGVATKEAGERRDDVECKPMSDGSSASTDNNRYWTRRLRNNVAVRKSREKKKMREREIEGRVKALNEENLTLRRQLETLSKQVDIFRKLFGSFAATLPSESLRRIEYELEAAGVLL